jgi:nucleotide-binding universal stress UspA family protein
MRAFFLSQSAREAEATTGHDSTERRELAEHLQPTAASLASAEQSVSTKLSDGDPSHRIALFVDATPSSLLVLGTHGGGAERRLIGSVAERSLRRRTEPWRVRVNSGTDRRYPPVSR